MYEGNIYRCRVCLDDTVFVFQVDEAEVSQESQEEEEEEGKEASDTEKRRTSPRKRRSRKD